MHKFLTVLVFLSTCAPASSPKAVVAETSEESSVDTSFEVQNSFSRDYLMGKFDPAAHPDFVEIAAGYANRPGMYLRRDAYEAFLSMHAAALKAGVRLQIISAARNFTAQKGIWEAKWTGSRLIENGKNAAQAYPDPVQRALKILEYSSMPGSSRHHWGTDIDLNNLSPEFFKSGQGKKIHDWLTAHAAEYGFCQPYSPKGADRPYGYNEEAWHWSYTPVSRQLMALAGQILKNEDITGFAGAETAKEIDVVGKYVLGIYPGCLK